MSQVQRSLMTARSVTIAVALLLVAAACSSVSDPVAQDATIEESPDGGVAVGRESPTSETAGVDTVPDEGFCNGGNSFVTDTKARLVATPDATTFVDIDSQLGALEEQSPGDIVESVVALRTGFAVIGDAYAATGYEPSATLTLDPETQDATALAGSTLRSYLLKNCDLAAVREAQVDQIVEAFGIQDLATAECIHTQLGDLANIDAATLSPELMTAPVCGTSIIGLLSGGSTSGS